jgi:hypothetical protein
VRGDGARKIALCGVCAAGAVVFLLITRISPTGKLALAAVASLFVAAAAIECGLRWGILTWIATAALGLALGGAIPELWLYAAFFGVYPVVKIFAERRNKILAWLMKLALLAWAIAATVLWFPGVRPSVAANFNTVLLIALYAAAFTVFDIGYGKLMVFYRGRISPSARRQNR